MKILKQHLPVIAAAAAWLIGAGDASAFTPFQSNLQNGTGWTDTVSQDSAAETFGPSGLTISTNPFGSPLQFQRQAVAYTGSNDLEWLSNPGSVSYSFTISDFANPTTVVNGGYEANLLIVGNQGGALPNFADFNAANVLMLRVVDLGPSAQLGGANGYAAELLYKAANPSQSIFPAPFGVGEKVAAIYNMANPLGTWSITLNGQNAFITAPDGTVSQPGQFTGDGVMGADVLSAFNNTGHLYLQVNNGNTAAGDSITFSNVAAIPEPSTVLSMICGLGLVAGRFLMSRNRRKLA